MNSPSPRFAGSSPQNGDPSHKTGLGGAHALAYHRTTTNYYA